MRHFVEELEELKAKLLEMSSLVESAIYRSITAVVQKDELLAREVLTNEARVNQIEIEIDDLAISLLALQQPMATDLRLIVSAIKINNDLERMGDLAVNIAERALDLLHEPIVKPMVDIPHIAALVQSMVRKSLDAFVARDGDLARSVLASDDAVDDLRNASFHELLSFMEHDPRNIRQSMSLLSVVRNLERIADHATNIAEDVLFLAKGIDVRHHAESRV
ncbi:MAG TPA: phosphate signaling complex protein PhoU [Bryobacteraceae bacterium]|nr:phosphate signaling complex protein PhoU [Bryobacteraceae bacterium]